MLSVVLDAFPDECFAEEKLKLIFAQKDDRMVYFKLKDLNIRPCLSCGSCAHTTPGECAVKDDMPHIMRAIAPCDLLVLLTPIRFGGYSAQLKKVVDKLMLMGLPLYMMKNGHLLHPMRYPGKSLLAVGRLEDKKTASAENFRTLVKRNAVNMQFPYSTAVFDCNNDSAGVEIAMAAAVEGARAK